MRLVKNSVSLAVSYALLGGVLVFPAATTAQDAECPAGSCEKPAPYTLKIITHGEGAPVSDNNSPQALQQNRRVDVSVSREVPVEAPLKPVADQPNEPSVAAALPSEALSTGGQGTFWVSQDPSNLERLLGLKVPASATLEQGVLADPLQISIASNYPAFIDRWELYILPEGGAVSEGVLHKTEGKLVGNLTELEWNGAFNSSVLPDAGVKVGAVLQFVLRVYDVDGNYDETAPSVLEFVAPETGVNSSDAFQSVDALTVQSLSEQLTDFNRELVSQSIPVQGGLVTVHGQGLRDVKALDINGDKVVLNTNNSFSVEYILPAGEHQFDVSATRQSGVTTSNTLTADVKPGYFFLVGLADITAGKNDISGSIEPLAVDDKHFGDDLFVDGRLAFYLKGKVRGKYLITSQLDTGIEGISELFDDFNRQDPSTVFRRIDPDVYYLVYGDDSTIVDDTDSKGKFYLRVDWDNSHALWGNFNTAFSGTEFAPFNRSLYGAQFRHKSLASTSLGDSKTEFSAFASEAQTLFRHNEFLGTGGSLYYLRDQEVVLGSEKVWVEVRRNDSEQVVQRIPLVSGRDYEIDEFQGRIILTRPLLSASAEAGPSIIREQPELTDNTYLVVDYEYIPTELVSGDAAAGVRAKRWLNDHIAIAGTVAHENRETADYNVRGIDVTVKKTDNTFFRVEVAQSDSSQTSGSYLSTDGGFTFTPFNSNAGVTSGEAYGAEARVSVNDFVPLDKPVTAAAWVKNRTAGFSAATLDSGADTTDSGVEVIADISDSLSVSGRATRLERQGESVESNVAVQADYKYSSDILISGEIRRIDDEVVDSGVGESATLGAAKVQVQLNDAVSVYGIAQGTIQRSSSYSSNSILTAGASAQVSDSLSLSGEVSAGERGTNLTFGLDKTVSDTYGIYTNLSIFSDSDNSIEQLVTFGQRKTLTDRLKVFTEHQFSSEEHRTGLSNTIGLSHSFSRYANASLSFQSSRLEDQSDSITRRDSISAGFSFKQDQSYFSSKVELRYDESDTVDTDQFVITNSLEYRQSVAMRWQGRLNHSETEDNISGDNARFTEAGIGFAYRPVVHDRLNVLGRYTYLFDLPPLSQGENTDRRSEIYSFESIYELGKRWRVGGKLAHRQEEIRLQRNGDGWIGNDATLASLRLRYEVPFGFDAMASYHWLKSDLSDNMRQGALLSIGHNVGSNLQFSVGYNFTSFDDNLQNEDYDVRGWFLNLVGKY